MLSRGDEDEVAGHGLWVPAGAVAPTLVRLTTSSAGVPEGDPLALAAEVVTVSTREQAGTATGTVSFAVDGQLVGTAVLDAAGQAVLSGVQLPAGVHAVVASYAGDARHAAASSAPLPQAVTAPAAPVVVLVAAPVRVDQGQLLEAEVADPRTGRVAEDASGAVVFTAAGVLLGSAPLVRGCARLVVDSLPPGRLRASFSGDAEHASAVGAAPQETA